MPDVFVENRNGVKTTIIISSEFDVITKGTKKYSTIPAEVIASDFARFFAKINGNSYVFNSHTSLDFFSLYAFSKENEIRANLYEHMDEVYFHQSRSTVGGDAIFPIRNFFDIDVASVGKEVSLVSGGFFLLQTKEVDSRYNWFGDPFGMLVSNFKVYSYSTFKRSCIIQDDENNCFFDRLCCEDFDYGYNNIWHTPIFVYSRSNIQSHIYLNCEKGFVDYLLLNGIVLDKKYSGRMECPVSGIIVRFTYKDAPDWEIGLRIDVRFSKNKKRIKFAIQCAPALIVDNNIALKNSSFYDDYLYDFNNSECLVPRIYAKGCMIGCDRIKAGIGFTRNKDLMWCALESSDSITFSLFDVAKKLLEYGAVIAIALDGGGSVKAYHNFNEIVGAKDKRRSNPYFIELR
ncbi:hypothetical protein FACS1894188_08450 [Clostridia bacterium]|nr:hypothetical protein FACS1894188_08450 [Clostridia bacterium]